jgi:WD40 repeat protein
MASNSISPLPDSEPKAKAFVSYSRKDAAFADRLDEALRARGFEALIDRTEIYAFEDWWKRIEALIVQADTVIFVLSPDAIASPVCHKEIAFASSLSKRFAPIVCRRVDDREVPEALQRLNFISFENAEQFDERMDRLAEALVTDIDWVRKHTELGEVARRWSEAGRPGPHGLLLRSPVLEEAERWIGARPRNAPPPPEATQAFIAESRRAATQRRNTLTASLGAGLVVALGLAGLTYWQWGVAAERRDEALIAQSRFLMDRSTQQRGIGNFSTSVNFAMEALPENIEHGDRPYVPEAAVALHSALQELKERAIFDGHGGQVTSLNFSQDGRSIVSVSTDATARIWDTATGKIVTTLQGEGQLKSAVFSPDGNQVVTVFSAGDARLWEAASGTVIAVLKAPTGELLERAYFTPNGRRIIGEAQSAVRVWSTDNAGEIATFEGTPLAHTIDEGRIATVTKNLTVDVWETETGRPLAILAGHTDPVTGAAFSSDGSRIVTCSLDHTARIWNIDAPQIALSISHESRVTGCAFHPNGSQIVTVTSDHTGRTWDAVTGQKIIDLAGDEIPIGTVSYVADGHSILTQSGDVHGISMRLYDQPAFLWDSQSGVLRTKLQEEAAVSQDGRYLLAASRVWSAETGQEVTIFGNGPNRVSQVIMSSDAEMVAGVADDVVVLWQLSGIGFVTDLLADVKDARFSPDGERILTWAFDGVARIWNADTGRIDCILDDDAERLNEGAFSPDGRRVVTISQDATGRLWDAKSCRLIMEMKGHNREVTTVVFSRDGRRIATGSADRTVRLWNGLTGEVILPAITGFERSVDSVQFTPDGKMLVTEVTGQRARFWNVENGEEVPWLDGDDTEGHVIFSPDGKRMLTSSNSGLKLRDAGTGRLLFRFPGAFDSINFALDGRFMASTDKEIHIWDAGASQISVFNVNNGAARALFSPAGRSVIVYLHDDVALLDAKTGETSALYTQGENDTAYNALFSPDGTRMLIVYKNRVRLSRIPKSTQDLIKLARQMVPRCLSAEERMAVYLPTQPPRWCAALGKWPYSSADRK